MNNTTKKVVSAIKGASKPKTTGYDTTAVVKRVEGNIAWVHIPGGVDETPVSMTINAEPGETVQVRVSGGRAWLTGNATAPPTDDKRAIIGEIWLLPENDAYDPIDGTYAEIIGIVKALCREY